MSTVKIDGIQPLSHSLLSEGTLPGMVARPMTYAARDALSELLLSDVVCVDDIAPALAAAVRAAGPGAVAAAYRHEETLFEPETKPVHGLVQQRTHADLPTLAPCSVEAAVNDVTRSPLQISDLLRHRDALRQTNAFGFLQGAYRLSDESSPGWGNRLYGYVHGWAADFDSLAAPPDALGSLSFICFLPSPMRGLTRRLVTNATVYDQINRRLGEEELRRSSEMLAAVQSYLVNSALSGYHWERVIRTPDFSEDNLIEHTKRTMHTLEALTAIRTFRSQSLGHAVVDAYEEAYDAIRLAVHAQNLGRLAALRQVDIGHGFDSFADITLEDALLSSPSESPAALQKIGLRALILEDSKEQMEAYRRYVDDHTVFATDPTLCLTEPTKVREHACDESIGLYVIDVQNGANDVAGITFACTLLRERVAVMQQQIKAGAAPAPIEVIVWSSSEDHVQAASNELHALVDSLPADGVTLDASFPGNVGVTNASALLKIRVTLKGRPDFGAPRRR